VSGPSGLPRGWRGGSSPTRPGPAGSPLAGSLASRCRDAVSRAGRPVRHAPEPPESGTDGELPPLQCARKWDPLQEGPHGNERARPASDGTSTRARRATAFEQMECALVPAPVGWRGGAAEFRSIDEETDEPAWPYGGDAGAEALGLDNRHTFGSQLAQRDTSLFQIAALMGNRREVSRRH